MNNRFKQALETVHGKICRYKRYIICFVIVFGYSAMFFSPNISKWCLTADTSDYFALNLVSRPWNGARAPGVMMYVKGLGKFELVQNFFNFETVGRPADEWYQHEMDEVSKMVDAATELAAADKQINDALKYISNANYVLLCIGIAALAVALACHIHIVPAIIMPCLLPLLTTLPDTTWIMADQPAAVLALMFTALILVFLRIQKDIFLFFACLCAVYAFLVKPQMIFLPAIAGVIVCVRIIAVRHNAGKWLRVVFMGIFLIAGTLIWPVWLYINGGVVVTGQWTGMSKAIFTVYLMQPGDEDLFSDPEDKKLVEALLKHKPEVDRGLDETQFPLGRESYSASRIFFYSIQQYGWEYFPEIFQESRPGVSLTPLEWVRVSQAVCEPILKAHYGEYVKTVAQSFLSAFGRYHDNQLSPFGYKILDRRGFFQRIGYFKVFVCIYILIITAILLGKKGLRWPLVFITSIHPLAVAACAIGYAVEPRYIEVTEWSLLLACILACWSLWVRMLGILGNIGYCQTL
jgi:hypothetical protein